MPRNNDMFFLVGLHGNGVDLISCMAIIGLQAFEQLGFKGHCKRLVLSGL